MVLDSRLHSPNSHTVRLVGFLFTHSFYGGEDVYSRVMRVFGSVLGRHSGAANCMCCSHSLIGAIQLILTNSFNWSNSHVHCRFKLLPAKPQVNQAHSQAPQSESTIKCVFFSLPLGKPILPLPIQLPSSPLALNDPNHDTETIHSSNYHRNVVYVPLSQCPFGHPPSEQPTSHLSSQH